MDHICLTIPVLPGQGAGAREFMSDLEGSQRSAYAESEQRIGIEKELWFISDLGEQELLVAYMESGDFGRAFEQFVASREPFDLWFKEQLGGITGIDLNAGPPPNEMVAETLAEYKAKGA